VEHQTGYVPRHKPIKLKTKYEQLHLPSFAIVTELYRVLRWNVIGNGQDYSKHISGITSM